MIYNRLHQIQFISANMGIRQRLSQSITTNSYIISIALHDYMQQQNSIHDMAVGLACMKADRITCFVGFIAI
jgi:hypothetical protein